MKPWVKWTIIIVVILLLIIGGTYWAKAQTKDDAKNQDTQDALEEEQDIADPNLPTNKRQCRKECRKNCKKYSGKKRRDCKRSCKDDCFSKLN